MATLSNAGRSAACDAIVDRVDLPGGAGSGTGRFVLQEAGPTTLATFNLNTTAFGAAANGVATAGQSPALSTTASASGTASLWQIQSNAGATLEIDGTISTSGPPTSDLTIDNASIVNGQTILITSLTVTVPAS